MTRRDVSNVLGSEFWTADRRLLAYGGLVHMFLSSGYVARVDDGMPIHRIRDFVPSDDARPPDSGQPENPIDLLVEDRVQGGFWGVSDHVLYRVSTDLSVWTKWTDLGGRFDAGRRFSVGKNTPTIAALVPGAVPGELFVISRRDGIQHIVGRDVQRRFFANQLEDDIVDIWGRHQSVRCSFRNSRVGDLRQSSGACHWAPGTIERFVRTRLQALTQARVPL